MPVLVPPVMGCLGVIRVPGEIGGNLQKNANLQKIEVGVLELWCVEQCFVRVAVLIFRDKNIQKVF